MPRPRGPEDRKPLDAPAFPEPGGTRWELPFTFKGTKGLLVIRTFDVPRSLPSDPAETFDTEASSRGRAVLLLDAERRNTR
jgi:hypothetical protein